MHWETKKVYDSLYYDSQLWCSGNEPAKSRKHACVCIMEM